MYKTAPIALFVYDRLDHARRAVESLRSNGLAKDSELFIFSDEARDEKSGNGVRLVRDYVKTISGFKQVVINENKSNLGPSRNIIEGVTGILNRYEKVIVVEDDLNVSRYFLEFMNDALSKYENEPKVISVCGYMYPIKIRDRETVFLRMTDCWGWATWKRGWDLFEPDAEKLLGRIRLNDMGKKFNMGGSYDFLRILQKQTEKKVSSWAICWYASALLNNKLSLYPAKSLVRNIGLDDSGTHCSSSFWFDTDILQRQVLVSQMPVEEERAVINKLTLFFYMTRLKKILQLINNRIVIKASRKDPINNGR